jgi:hypothetical protein
MEEAAFLMPVQGVVGGVEIDVDLARRRLVRDEEEIDEQPLDGGTVIADLVVARGSDRRVLEPVERALAGERGAAPASGPELAGEGREHRVMAQLVVVDEVPSFGGGDDGLGVGLPDERPGLTVVRRDEAVDGNTPRLSWRLASLANRVSTAFSQEHEVGAKWKIQRGCRVSQRRTWACLWAA